MPTIFGFVIVMLTGLVPTYLDELLGTNLSEIITQESVAEVTLAPFVWAVNLLQELIIK